MKNFLKRIKLIDNLTTELEITKLEFVNRLSASVDQAELGFFSDTFDIFTSSKNMYKGNVNQSGFEIKKRRRFFDRQFGFAKAIGRYSQKNELLIIDTEISGWNNFMFFFYGVALLFYIFFIGMIIFSDIDNQAGFVVFPFILFHAAIMFYLPYRMMKSSVKKIKYDIEREFHYLVSKKHVSNPNEY